MGFIMPQSYINNDQENDMDLVFSDQNTYDESTKINLILEYFNEPESDRNVEDFMFFDSNIYDESTNIDLILEFLNESELNEPELSEPELSEQIFANEVNE